jgi:hypothetical protein
MRSLLSEFGMSPASRTKASASLPKEGTFEKLTGRKKPPGTKATRGL